MRRIVLAPAVLLSAALAGCGGGGDSAEAKPESGKPALQAALDAWKGGQPASGLLNSKPPIEMTDFEWKAGKALAGYTIDDDPKPQATQIFSVTLTPKGGAAKKVKYMVTLGDPVRITRDEDFKKSFTLDGGAGAAGKAGK